jgi:cell division protein FtsI/penicillin-binding protein 2
MTRDTRSQVIFQLIVLIALVVTIILAKFVYQTPKRSTIYLSSILAGQNLPLSSILNSEGWFIHRYKHGPTIVLGKNTKEVLHKRWETEEYSKTFVITSFESYFGLTIEEFALQAPTRSGERVKLQSPGFTYFSHQAPPLSINVRNDRVTFKSEFLGIYTYGADHWKADQPFILSRSHVNTFYLFPKIDKSAEIFLRGVGFHFLGKEVYKISIEFSQTGALVVDTAFYNTAKSDGNDSDLWKGTIYAGRSDKVVSESALLKNEDIDFVDSTKIEGKAFVKDLVDNGILVANADTGKMPISFIGDEDLLCDEQKINCVELSQQNNASVQFSKKHRDLIKDLYRKAVGQEVRSQVRTFNDRTLLTSVFLSEEDFEEAATNGINSAVRSYSCDRKGGENSCIEIPIKRESVPTYLSQKVYSSQYSHYLKPELGYLGKKPEVIRYEFAPNNRAVIIYVTGEEILGRSNKKKIAKGLFEIELPRHSNGPLYLDVEPQNCGNSTCSAYKNENLLALSIDESQQSTWHPRVLGFPFKFQSEGVSVAELGDGKNKFSPIYAMSKLGKKVPLFAKNGDRYTITDFARDELGLSNLIGEDERWLHHLGAATRGLGREMMLSIKPSIQQMVVQSVQDVEKDRITRDSTFKENLKNGAKVSLVMMETKTGEIVAAYTSQGGEGGYQKNSSDLNLDLTYPNKSQYRWSPVFHDNKASEWPGSTFKLFEAITLFDHVNKERPFSSEIATLLQGVKPQKFITGNNGKLIRNNQKGRYVYAKEMQLSSQGREWVDLGSRQQFLFNPFALSYPVKIKNAGQLRISTDPFPVPKKESTEGVVKIGLAEAIQWSHNAWFSWMVERTSPVVQYLGESDRNREYGIFGLESNDPKYENVLIPVKATVARVGFDKCINLLGNSESKDCTDDAVYNSWILRPILFNKIDNVHRLRRLAFGYNVTLAPLHLATLSAMIAENRIMAPSLIEDSSDKIENELLKDENQIKIIRDGMNKVVTGGTARWQFGPEWNGRIWAKTGTTEEGKNHRYRNLWLTGYFCGEPNSARGGECGKRFSFACNVSKAGKGGNNAGATACGPLVKEVILLGDQKGLWN